MGYPSLQSGIYELMRDLGQGLNDPDTLMLGGGNPAILEATQTFFSPILKKVADNPGFFRKGFQSYSHPQGEENFIATINDYFSKMTGWDIKPHNLCVTQGSQQGFYMLYNYLIDRFHSEIPSSKSPKPVLVAIKAPDYIGYFDLIPKNNFLSVNGKIQVLDDGTFKYSIDFPSLERLLEQDGRDYDIRGLVISSPNNPSSHVLSQDDTDRLDKLAKHYNKLIIFDHAYGFPFPNIIFGNNPRYPFNPHTLHCFSFSKIGLPGIRTGIMIGPHDLIDKMIVLNGIVNLSPSSLTSAFLDEVLRSPGFNDYIAETLYPHYSKRKETAFQILNDSLQGSPAMLHQPQGGFFLWLRAPKFPLTSYALYEEIKEQKVVVVPGNYFFLKASPESSELSGPSDAYLRISYTMEEDKVNRGLKIIGDTVKKYYR